MATPKEHSGLTKDSVINTTQLTAIDKSWLDDFVTTLPRHLMKEINIESARNGLLLCWHCQLYMVKWQ